MFRSSVVLVAVIACGGAELHDSTTPVESNRELAANAAGTGHSQLAWAYTVIECQSQTATDCALMWKQYSRLAPTQTDALNVLHAACSHIPAACEQLASWHAEHRHSVTAAVYRKRADAARQTATAPTRGASALALATELAALMHAAGAPHTEAIDQMVGEEIRAPIARTTLAKPRPKAWPMHAADVGSNADGCVATAPHDRHEVPLAKCIAEVRPFDGDQIAIVNRCGAAVNVAFSGARGDQSAPIQNTLRLDRYQARSIGLTHQDVGTLTYAVCADGCRVTGSLTTQWTADSIYDCAKGGP